MKIILVRHGESEANMGLTEHEDSPLTKKGKTQAEHLGRSLKKEKISAIYTSTLVRAKQTGEIISKIIKVPVNGHLEELSEYPSKHVRNKFVRLFDMRAKRLKKFLDEIAKDKEENKTILIVAHGVANRIIFSYFLGIPLRKQFFRLTQNNTAVNIFLWNKEYNNWNLNSMNDITHLPRRLIGG